MRFYYMTNQVLLQAQDLYRQAYQQALKKGLLPQSAIYQSLIERGILTQEDQNTINYYRKNLKTPYIYTKPDDEEVTRMYYEVLSGYKYIETFEDIPLLNTEITEAHQQLYQLIKKRDQYLQHSAEHKAQERVDYFIVQNLVKDNEGNPIEINKTIIEWYNIFKTNIDVRTLRALARGQGEAGKEWRLRWMVGKQLNQPLFNIPFFEWDNLKLNLCYWSLFYDMIFNLAEPPDDYIIENDQVLDNWFENYKAKLNKTLQEPAYHHSNSSKSFQAKANTPPMFIRRSI